MNDENSGQRPVEDTENHTDPDNVGDAHTGQGDDTDTGCEPGNEGNAAEPPTETVTPGDQSVVIDLRPPAESVKAELVRLGLCYDRVDQATGTEIWRDYARHLMAEFPNDAGEPVTLTDLRTGIGRSLTRDQLTDVTRIIVSGEERS